MRVMMGEKRRRLRLKLLAQRVLASRVLASRTRSFLLVVRCGAARPAPVGKDI